MRKKLLTIACLATAIVVVLLALMSLGCSQQTAPPPAQQQATPSVTLPPWGPQHDRNAPQPPVVNQVVKPKQESRRLTLWCFSTAKI